LKPACRMTACLLFLLGASACGGQKLWFSGVDEDGFIAPLRIGESASVWVHVSDCGPYGDCRELHDWHLTSVEPSNDAVTAEGDANLVRLEGVRSGTSTVKVTASNGLEGEFQVRTVP
jgi:hypothetical protein